MDWAEIKRRHRALVQPGFGTISASEALFLQDQIAEHKPARFIEIGTATGLSTGFIALFLDAHSGTTLISVDYDDRFYGDRTKPVGYLVKDLYAGHSVTITFKTNATSLDALGGPFEMGFVDGNHQHPWPVIDTLALYPQMVGPKRLLHHDLRLFSDLGHFQGVGPKYLFDQFPESHRQQGDARGGNIFCLDLNVAQPVFEAAMKDALSLPWSLLSPLTPLEIDRIRAMLKTHYTSTLSEHFEACLAFYGDPNYSVARHGPPGRRQLVRWFAQGIRRKLYGR